MKKTNFSADTQTLEKLETSVVQVSETRPEIHNFYREPRYSVLCPLNVAVNNL